MMALSMTLQYMDKQALPAASILGIIQDLVSPRIFFLDSCAHLVSFSAYHEICQKLSGGQYSWASSIFWFGYLASTYATPYLMIRLPIGKVLSCTL